MKPITRDCLSPLVACFFALLAGLLCSADKALAWGKTGHEIVAEIAMRTLSEPARQQVKQCLENVTPEKASVWMDEMRSDHDYDFMKPWHYINIPEGQAYQVSGEENIVSMLTQASRELRHRNTLCADQARKDLMILFHLVGDLHQPLHDGYASDKGGNDIKLDFEGVPSNLHWIWDDQIIQQQHISLEDCLKLKGGLSEGAIRTLTQVDFVRWMTESRAHLPEVYSFKGNTIDAAYSAAHSDLIRTQLLYAGLRLGALLESLFNGASPVANAKTPASDQQKTIRPEDAQQYIGKDVTICGKVYGGKFLAQAKGTPTLINMGAAYPASPFTMVIFGEDRSRFSYTPETFLDGKDICVTGKVKLFKGKAEIVVSDPGQIKLP
ncbi:S1/P1 nuclease [Taibaiella koreensis]|uniref:S1/P1 nuclease n=1 Tax=Taibaiella koreensis TaxID=1268548 RepID=UPI000E59D0F8|nr:S1/P1 nuclease [Taibaiella koreensis]